MLYRSKAKTESKILDTEKWNSLRMAMCRFQFHSSATDQKEFSSESPRAP